MRPVFCVKTQLCLPLAGLLKLQAKESLHKDPFTPPPHFRFSHFRTLVLLGVCGRASRRRFNCPPPRVATPQKLLHLRLLYTPPPPTSFHPPPAHPLTFPPTYFCAFLFSRHTLTTYYDNSISFFCGNSRISSVIAFGRKPLSLSAHRLFLFKSVTLHAPHTQTNPRIFSAGALPRRSHRA